MVVIEPIDELDVRRNFGSCPECGGDATAPISFGKADVSPRERDGLLKVEYEQYACKKCNYQWVRLSGDN